MGVCICSMFCCTLLYVHSSIAIILMGKRELIALLNLSSWCLVMVERLFLAVPRGCLQFVIVVFPDHTHLLFTIQFILSEFTTLCQILTNNIYTFRISRTIGSTVTPLHLPPIKLTHTRLPTYCRDRHMHAKLFQWSTS